MHSNGISVKQCTTRKPSRVILKLSYCKTILLVACMRFNELVKGF